MLQKCPPGKLELSESLQIGICHESLPSAVNLEILLLLLVAHKAVQACSLLIAIVRSCEKARLHVRIPYPYTAV